MAHTIKKGWMYETMQYIKNQNIEICPQLFIKDSMRKIDTKEGNKQAMDISRTIRKISDIKNQVIDNWYGKLIRTISDTHSKQDNHKNKYTWFINEIISEYEIRDIMNTNEVTVINIVDCFLRFINNEHHRNCAIHLITGAWKLGRIMAGNDTTIIEMNNDEDVDIDPNDHDYRRKCPHCWIMYKTINIEDERHVLFDCDAYVSIREKMYR